jgi:hypothetical protein
VTPCAYNQHQLDVYGELMDALHYARRAGLARSDEAWRVQRAVMRFLETAWMQPDEGIWEIRGPRRHFTHSKVMAWVAMDRLARRPDQHCAQPRSRGRARRGSPAPRALRRGCRIALAA